jgi:type IV pilus assembly protein PilW
MNSYPVNLHSKTNAGFSLIDIMVGMVIALLGIIIIFQVFSVSEGIKRTTTSSGDALQSGSSALFALGRALKGAGYGFFSSTNLPPRPADPLGTAPVTITPGATNASDSMALRYRQNWDYGSFPPDPTAFTSASSVPPALTCETISIQVNAAGLAQLVSTTISDPTPVAGACPTGVALTNNVISEGIALMKLEYGTDTSVPPDGIVDVWNQTAPTAANVMNVLAIRVAVVARSANPEDKDATGNRATGTNCATTTTYPTSSLATAPTLDLSGNTGLATGDSWKCYRYKTFETTVPLRNVIWRP